MITGQTGEKKGGVVSAESQYTLKIVHDLAVALAKHVEADKLIRREIDDRERTLGCKHPDTLVSFQNLCVLLVAQGNYDAAEEVNRQLLKDRKKVFGLEHPDTLESLFYRATIISMQEKNREAQQISAMEKELGPEHPLESIKSFADALRRQGKRTDARYIFQRVIKICETILGVEHLATLSVIKALADILTSEGAYKMAEAMYRRVVDGQHKRLGKSHSLVLASTYSLSTILAKQDKYNAVDEEIYKQAFRKKKKEFGMEHLDTMECVDNLAEVLWRQDKYSEAEKMYRYAVEGRTKMLGSAHVESRVSMNNLVVALDCQNQYAAAKNVIRRGLGKSYNAQSLFPLAEALLGEFKYTKAAQMMRRVLEGRKKVLGLGHLDTLDSVAYLGYVLTRQGEWTVETEALHRQHVRFSTAVLGSENAMTLNSRFNLGITLSNRGKHSEAEQVFRQLMKSKEKALGTKHEDTLEVVDFLASELRMQRKYQEAEELCQKFANDKTESNDIRVPKESQGAQKPPPSTPDPYLIVPDLAAAPHSDSRSPASLETDAFLEAARECKNFIVMEKTNSWPINPIRLLNIRTGKTESPRSKASYVIASYIWHPQRLPDNPFGGLFEGNSSREIDDPIEFDKRLNRVCGIFPEFVTRHSQTADANDIVLPIEYCSGLEVDYQREVYLLAAQEADLRGLDYVWMDCLCIDQRDEKDIAANLPLMAGYYRRAECCVAVSEVLRRKLCFNDSSAGLDFDWVPGDDILSWIVGFHHLRTWLLQETFLSPEIFTRGGNIRIKSSQFLIEYNGHFLSKIFSCPAFLCKDPSYTHFKSTATRFPTSVSRTEGNQNLTPHHCLELLRHRDRTTDQDLVYGGLGLLSPMITSSMPINYQLSTGSLYAILTYLRICTGETSALLTLRRYSEKRHQIAQAPSWIPTGTGAIFPDGRGQPLILPDHKLAQMKWPQILTRAMQYMYIAEIKPAEPPSSHRLINHNVLLTLRSCQNNRLSKSFEGAIEPLGYWPNGPGNEEDVKDYNAGMREIEDAVPKNRAVIALLGQHQMTSAWMILCAIDDGKTWRRLGLARTDGITQKEMEINKPFRIT